MGVEHRLPKSLRTRIRRLKAQDRHEEADQLKKEAVAKKDWLERVDVHLKEGGFGGGVGSLEETELKALSTWERIRSRYHGGYYSEEELDDLRRKFSDEFDSVLDNEGLRRALSFITKQTEIRRRE